MRPGKLRHRPGGFRTKAFQHRVAVIIEYIDAGVQKRRRRVARVGQMVYKHTQELQKLGKLFLAENHYLLSEVRPDSSAVSAREYLADNGPWKKSIRARPTNLKTV